MEPLGINEEQVQCPYNSSHFILKYRLEKHLIKCRRSYTGPKSLKICNFNATHRIPSLELEIHHQICPNRIDVERQLSSEASSSSGAFALPPVPSVPVDTSWDDDDEVPTYDPQQYCEANPVLRHLDTESAEKKRDFRNAERKRFQQLEMEQRDSRPGSSKASSSAEMSQTLPKPESDANTVSISELLQKASVSSKRRGRKKK